MTDIISICGDSLKEDDVKSGVRPYNMYKSLEFLGCKVKYLDAWNPSYKLTYSNISKWLKLILSDSTFSSNYIFIENLPSSSFISFLRRFKKNIPVYLDIRDDQTIHAESLGLPVPQSLFLKREYDEYISFSYSNKIILTSESYREYYSQKYKGKFDSKFLVVINSTDPLRFSYSPLPKPNKIGILCGLSVGEGIDLFLNSAREVKKVITDLEVHLGYKYQIESQSYVNFIRSEYSEDWINFYEDIDYSSNAPEFFKMLKLAIIPRRKTKVNDISTPSKIFDSMSTGRPLVVTNLIELSNIIKKGNCGLVCEENELDMSSKIIELLSNDELIQKFSINGRKAVENEHNWNNQARILVNSFSDS